MRSYYKTLPLELKYRIALESNYRDLLNLCKTSREAFEEICGNNYFWEKKTYHDFGDLYDIEPTKILYGVADLYEDFEEGDWWETYQHYRSVFSKDFIRAILEEARDRSRNRKEVERLFRIAEKRGFLIVDETDEEKFTALIGASGEGYTDIVKMLLEAGADPDRIAKNGDTALMSASYMDYTDIVKMLLEAGADPNLENESGWTALTAGASENSAKIIRSYIES